MSEPGCSCPPAASLQEQTARVAALALGHEVDLAGAPRETDAEQQELQQEVAGITEADLRAAVMRAMSRLERHTHAASRGCALCARPLVDELLALLQDRLGQ